MAHQNRITNWVLRNKLLLQPEFTSFDWPDRYRNGVFEFQLRMTKDGICAEGRGIAVDSALALEKASAEAVERWLCHALNYSSVGVAVSGAESSEVHAKNELLERFFLSEHIRSDQPFLKIPKAFVEKHPRIKLILKKLIQLGFETQVEFFKMNTGAPHEGVVCKMTDASYKKSILGFALSDTLAGSLEHSLMEALPNYFAFKDSMESEASSDIEVLSRNLQELPWHLGDLFLQKIQPLLDGAQDQRSEQPFSEPSVQIEKIDISPFPFLEDCPITPVRAVLAEGLL